MTDTDNLIKFVYEKTVNEEDWTLEIIEDPRGREIQKSLAVNSSKSFYEVNEKETDARVEFTETFSDFFIAVDDLAEEYDTSSVRWHWEVGKLIDEMNPTESLRRESLPKLSSLIPHDEVDDNSLRRSKNIYLLFPDGDFPDTDRATMLSKLKYYADSIEEARNVIDRAQSHDFVPMNREIRVWKDVRPDPELDEVASEVNRRFPSYENPESKVKFVRHAFLLAETPGSEVPADDEILAAIEEQES